MGEKHFIEGIYNYCDRWCERCADTDRCRLYDRLQRDARRRAARGEDPDDPEVAIADVRRALKRTMRLVTRHAKRMGLDLDAIAREAARAPAPDWSTIDDHPLAREGMAYLDAGLELIEAVRQDFGETRDDVAQRSRFMEVNEEVDALAGVAEAADVLNWDVSLVAVKIKRVLGGLLKDAEADADDERFHLEDAQATAGLVLRCLQRDARALLAIYDWSDAHRDRALDLLAKTERLGRALRQAVGAPRDQHPR